MEAPPRAGAEDAGAPEGRLARRFQRGFLAGTRLADLPWEDLEEILKNSKDSSALLTILQKTVLHSLSLKYPPSVKYRRCFISELIKKHESTAAEPLNQLYEALGDVLNTEEMTQCYKSYLLREEEDLLEEGCIHWRILMYGGKYLQLGKLFLGLTKPSGDAITLCESTAIISRGTTGLVTWDAGLYLAEWALENPAVFRNRSVLELGSGMGLTGITICKACHPRAYIFSDHHQCVLQQLLENIHLNGFFVESEFFQQAPTSAETRKPKCTGPQGPGIVVAELDWHLVTKEQLAELRAEVIVAADVVYDPELTQSLISVLQKLSSDNSGRQAPDVYIASTIRNPDTYSHFQKELEKVGIRWQLVPSPQKNLFPYDRHATINILRLLL